VCAPTQGTRSTQVTCATASPTSIKTSANEFDIGEADWVNVRRLQMPTTLTSTNDTQLLNELSMNMLQSRCSHDSRAPTHRPVATAVERMWDENIGTAIVEDNGHVIGIHAFACHGRDENFESNADLSPSATRSGLVPWPEAGAHRQPRPLSTRRRLAGRLQHSKCGADPLDSVNSASLIPPTLAIAKALASAPDRYPKVRCSLGSLKLQVHRLHARPRYAMPR
jgi:hypothetical protein